MDYKSKLDLNEQDIKKLIIEKMSLSKKKIYIYINNRKNV